MQPKPEIKMTEHTIDIKKVLPPPTIDPTSRPLTPHFDLELPSKSTPVISNQQLQTHLPDSPEILMKATNNEHDFFIAKPAAQGELLPVEEEKVPKSKPVIQIQKQETLESNFSPIEPPTHETDGAMAASILQRMKVLEVEEEKVAEPPPQL